MKALIPSRLKQLPLFIGIILLALGNPAFAITDCTSEYNVTHPLAYCDKGNSAIDGSVYRIAVPANWNGSMLYILHGYGGPIYPVNDPQLFLDNGYALATIDYGYGPSDNTNNADFTVKVGVQELIELTGIVKSSFQNHAFPQPHYSYLVGGSMGTAITEKFSEQQNLVPPNTFQGSLNICDFGSGMASISDMYGNFQLAYDVIFGDPNTGTGGWKWGQVGYVPVGVDESSIFSDLGSKYADPNNAGKLQLIQDLIGIQHSQNSPLFTTAFFATRVTQQVEAQGGGGTYQNIDQRNYLNVITNEQRTQLHNLPHGALTNAEINLYLQMMNQRRNISADPTARAFVIQNYQANGDLQIPTITMKTLGDGIVPMGLDQGYAKMVSKNHKDALLLQLFTGTYANGHCDFTPTQVLDATNALDAWVRTGVKPSLLQFSPSDGFVDPSTIGGLPELTTGPANLK